MRCISFETWDVFTREQFAGNPLAVVLDARDLHEAELLNITREFNLSETVFIYPPKDESNRAALRIFTPAGELDFAGHPTLGAAHALTRIARENGDPTQDFRLELNAGVFDIAGSGPTLAFTNPNPPTANNSAVSADQISAALRLSAGDILSGPMVIGAPTEFLTVQVAPDVLSALTPDLTALSAIADEIYVVSGAPGDASRFLTRLFAPGFGIPEDPVTGSAHCGLAPYWKKHLNKSTFVAHQISQRRGELHVTVSDDDQRVELRGKACTVLQGRLRV